MTKESIKNFPEFTLTEALSVLAEMEGYSEIPVDIDTFIESEYYLGDLYGGFNSNGTPKVFPYWREHLRDIYPNPLKSPYEQVMVTGAIGIGKTTCALIGSAYDMYRLLLIRDPHGKFGLIKTDMIVLALFTATKSLGGSVLATQMRDILTSSPFFKNRLSAGPDGKLFDPKIGMVVGSRFGHTLGKAVVSAMIDEANFQTAIKGQFNETYTNVIRRMKSRFMTDQGLPFRLWVMSSKADASSPLEVLIEKSVNDDKIKTIQVSLWETRSHTGIYSGEKFRVYAGDENKDPFIFQDQATPSALDPDRIIDVPIEYYKDFEKDLPRSLQDIAGVSTSSNLTLFSSREQLLKAMIVPPATHKDVVKLTESGEDRLSDQLTEYLMNITHKSTPRFIHVDTALKGDNMGIAMCHSSGQTHAERLDPMTGKHAVHEEHIVTFDFAFGITNQIGEEIPFFKVREFIKDLRDVYGFNIAQVSTDGFQSSEFRQLLRKQNFETLLYSCDRTKDAFRNLKYGVKEERTFLPRNTHLQKELRELLDMGKKFDHPDSGCFTGDTRVTLSNGTTISFEDMMNSSSSYDVVSYNRDTEQFEVDEGYSPRITKWVSEILEIEMEDGSVIRCTPDHRFLTTNGYVQACNLTTEEEILTYEVPN